MKPPFFQASIAKDMTINLLLLKLNRIVFHSCSSVLTSRVHLKTLMYKRQPWKGEGPEARLNSSQIVEQTVNKPLLSKERCRRR